MHVVVIFGALSPYHLVRMAAAGNLARERAWRITTVERVGHQREYPSFGALSHRDVTVRRAYEVEHPCPADKESVAQLRNLLASLEPDCIVFGRSSPVYFSVLRWACENLIPCVLLSDSTALDFKRVFWKEALKKRVTRLFSAGFVSGKRARDYLLDLGMPSDQVALGYDVVDNAHFSVGAEVARQNASNVRKMLGLPARYFLASSRFLERKNLLRLLEAFASYSSDCGAESWHLVILGDGPLRSVLELRRKQLGLLGRVTLPGWIPYEDLPAYYALATAFILPSTSEQWGLVVNEAMAAGVAVLVSARCGCQPDLVRPGVNGLVFDPFDVGSMSNALSQISSTGSDCRKMGLEGQRIISDWSPDRFASGLLESVELAMAARPKALNNIDRFVLRALCPA